MKSTSILPFIRVWNRTDYAATQKVHIFPITRCSCFASDEARWIISSLIIICITPWERNGNGWEIFFYSCWQIFLIHDHIHAYYSAKCIIFCWTFHNDCTIRFRCEHVCLDIVLWNVTHGSSYHLHYYSTRDFYPHSISKKTSEKRKNYART